MTAAGRVPVVLLAVLLAVVTAASVACASGPPQPMAPPAGSGPVGSQRGGDGEDGGAGEFRRPVGEVLPSVVSVQVRDGRHSGTGFRVGIDRVVVTSAQAVAEADDGARISVVLADRTRRAATVLGRSTEVDIAALRVDDPGIPAMHSRSGLEQARAGDRVLVVSAAATGADPAMSATLRATDRRGVFSSGEHPPVLALDTGVDGAASGAPLINTSGDVLGVITTAAAAPGAEPGDRAFAIPVGIAREATFAIVDQG